jgi:hypothetical protein
MCESRKTIICVTDQKVSFGDFSADTIAVNKNDPFAADWVALSAGDDMEHALPIVERCTSMLYPRGIRKYKALTPEFVASKFDLAYWERLQRQIETKVLRKYHFTGKSFNKEGKIKCTATIYNNLCNRIDQTGLSLTFLICGFGDNETGHILVVDGRNAPTSYDSIGMWAIGSGAASALSALAFHADKHGLSVYSSLPEALYCACEAKFMAESAKEVGRNTFIIIMQKDARIRCLSPPGVQIIKKIWESKGAPRIPAQALKVIPQLVYSLDKPKDEAEARQIIEAMVGKPGYLEKKKAAAKSKDIGSAE